MSLIYMLKQDVRFYDNPTISYSYNNENDGSGEYIYTKVAVQSSIEFPANVLECGFMITQNTTQMYGGDANQISWLGAGVNNISYAGNQVNFSAWMQGLAMGLNNDDPPIPPIVSGNWLDNNVSYLTVLAIAKCS